MSRASATTVSHAWAAGTERRIVVLHGSSRGGKTRLAVEAAQRMTERSGIAPCVWTARALIDLQIDALIRETMRGLPERCVAAGGALIVEHMADLGNRPNGFEGIIRIARKLHDTGHPVVMTVTRMPPRSTQVLRWLRRLERKGEDMFMVAIP